MSEIKGNVYQLAGFSLRAHGRNKALSDVFAVFCGVNEDASNPPSSTWESFFTEGIPTTYYLSASDVARCAVFFNEGVLPHVDNDCARGKEIAIDLGPEKLREVLSLMSKLSAPEKMEKHERVYIPANKL